MIIAGIIIFVVAAAGLAVALVSRLKISPGLVKTGSGPGSRRRAIETACGLTSGAAILLALIIFIRFGSGPGRLAWTPGMESNPFFNIKKTVVPMALTPGKVIKETTVVASDAEQQADLGPVMVIIPAGTISKPETASASQAPGELSPPFGPGAAALAFVDIRIGAMTRFEKPLTLKFPVTASVIDPDLPPEQQFQAVYFDEKERSWQRAPFSVDPAGRTISIRTDHLTVYWIGNLFSLQGKHCTVYFLPSEIRPVNRNYEDALKITSRDRLPLSIIRDMAFFVDTAYESYRLPDTALPLPEDNIYVLAFLGSNASWFEKKTGKSETFTGTLSGTINVNCDAINGSADMMEVLRNDCAHELFHLVQREKYGIIAMDLYNFRQAYFWLDAAAEHAAGTLAWRTEATRHGRKLGPTRANEADIGFLKETLVSNRDPHRYQAARFIEYLMVRCRLKAAALLDIPQLDHTFSESFDKYMSTIGQDLTLARAFDDFASFFVFDPASPCTAGSGGIYLEVKKYFSGTLLRFKDAPGGVPSPVTEMDRSLAVNDKYTSDMTCFRPDTPCVLTLSVQQEDRYVSAGIFPKEGGRPQKTKTVFKDNPATFSLDAQETLVLLFTPLSAPQAVQVHVKPQRLTASLRVKTVDAATSRPVPAKVEATPAHGETIEKNGAEVVFLDVPAGDVQLSISAAGYTAASLRLVINPGTDGSVDHTVRLEPDKVETASFFIKVLDAGTGNALAAGVTVTPQGNGRPIVKNGSSAVFSGLKKGDYSIVVTARGYKARYGNFSIDPGERRENQSVCKLEREQGPVPRATVQAPPAVETHGPGSFDERMLEQRNEELRRLSDEIGQIWNKLQDCCSNQAHTGTAPDGMVAIMAVQKFGQCRLACRNCGMAFSTMANQRANGKTYYEHYRERVEYYDRLLRLAPPGFWDTYEYEKYGGLNIIKKR